MIGNIAKEPAKKLESQRGTVYTPVSGWSYAHHPSITRFAGKFWATWSNGIKNEDDCGQRVMLAESEDGLHWENIRPVVTPEMLGDPKKVLTAGGFYSDGNQLNLYYGCYGYKKNSLKGDHTTSEQDQFHVGTHLGVITSNDGKNWSAPQRLEIQIVPNHGPQKTSSGRLILSGNVMFPYTDNPDGINDYQLTGIYGNAFQGQPPCDDSESIQYVSQKNGWDALICEGSFYETEDRVLHMMLRSNSDFLWCSESLDDGRTWSQPYKTQYSDDGSKFHFGRLPDGRYYGVNNSRVRAGRNPLDLHLSQDGENFDRHFIIRDEPYEKQFEGMHKGGAYAYPHTLLDKGYLYVIYSKQKEAIEVTRILLDQL